MAAQQLISGIDADELDGAVTKARERSSGEQLPVRYVVAGAQVDQFAIEVKAGRVTVFVGGQANEAAKAK